MSSNIFRISIFTITLLLCLFLECFLEYKTRHQEKRIRWTTNLSLIFLGSFFVKMLFPAGALFISDFTKENGWGLLNLLNISSFFRVVMAVIILDLLIYFQHVLTHKIPLLWRFHKVHHTDQDLDATSALRFHPIEILGSTIYRALGVIVFGFSFEEIIIFEIILSSMTIFNHSNIGINRSVEKYLRYFIVTPQMHIIHHSTERFESDSNYGFSLSLWDRLFKTYTEDFQSKGEIGQRDTNKVEDLSLWALLKMPF